MLDILLIFFGAGLGGVLRYLVANSTYLIFGRQFPYGTLIVNVSGCFLMGFLFVLILERFELFGPQLRSFFVNWSSRRLYYIFILFHRNN